MTYAQLMAQAVKAREGAYMPYSQFAVGAALCAGRDGLHRLQHRKRRLYAYGLRRTGGLFKAVSDGRRDFAAIAVTGGPAAPQRIGHCPLRRVPSGDGGVLRGARF